MNFHSYSFPCFKTVKYVINKEKEKIHSGEGPVASCQTVQAVPTEVQQSNTCSFFK